MNFFASSSCERVERRARRRAAPPAPARDWPRDADVRRGLLAARGHVPALQARDHLALLDAAALLHAQPLEPAGGLGGDRGLALRDHVAGGVEHRDRLRGIRGRDGGGLDRHRAAEPPENPSTAAAASTTIPAIHGHTRRRARVVRTALRSMLSFDRSGVFKRGSRNARAARDGSSGARVGIITGRVAVPRRS